MTGAAGWLRRLDTGTDRVSLFFLEAAVVVIVEFGGVNAPEIANRASDFTRALGRTGS